MFGEFGSGANTKVIYVQTAIKPSDLGKTTLISDIPGSEAWPVRNLFQREVDERRVTKGLLKYLEDSKRVKFFNPLTLTVLPFDPEEHQILTAMPKIITSKVEEDGVAWNVIEMAGFYRYRFQEGETTWGEVEWNDKTVKLVAIDGQHRLSALKRFDKDPKGDPHFPEWSIPVVVLAFRGQGDKSEERSILEVTRSIFIYINKEAKPPNRPRNILLSDESIVAICTQELLQLSHANDLKAEQQRNADRVPLLFYDWRGEEDDGLRILSPASVLRIEEIDDWFQSYLVGEDFTSKQEVALGIQPVDRILKRAFVEKRLDPDASKHVRERARDHVVPAVAYLLEKFTPFGDYIAALRALEQKYLSQSDLARHAFHSLRFGSHHAGESQYQSVLDVRDSLIKEIVALKARFIKPPLDLDVGMRGVVCSFAELRATYALSRGKASVDWLEYARWYVPLLNRVWSDGWLDIANNADARTLLRHVIRNPNDTVANYRLEDAEDALGAYAALLACAYGKKHTRTPDSDTWSGKREELTERLQARILRGYKKEVRPLLKEEHPRGGKQLTEAVAKEATKRTQKHINRLDSCLDKIVS